jgi:hypothetical protein
MRRQLQALCASFREPVFESVPSRKYLAGHVTWFVLWVVTTGIALWLRPSPDGHGTHQQLGLPPCPSVVLFGRLCPGCGLTTSFAAAARFDLPFAIRANPFGPWLYYGFTLSAFVAVYGVGNMRRFRTEILWLNIGAVVFAVAFLSFGIWRFLLG